MTSVDPGFGQGSEEGLQFGAEGPGEPQRAGPGPVAALMELDMAPVVVELVFGQGAVGVDGVDDLIGEQSQVLGRQHRGLVDQQFLPGVEVGGIEAAPVDLAQGAGDDRHLLRADLPVALGRGQPGPDRVQRLAEHRGPRPDRLRGTDPTARLRPWTGSASRSAPAASFPDTARFGRSRRCPSTMIWWSTSDSRFRSRSKVCMNSISDGSSSCFQATVINMLDQMIKTGDHRVEGVPDRRNLGGALIGHTSFYSNTRAITSDFPCIGCEDASG